MLRHKSTFSFFLFFVSLNFFFLPLLNAGPKNVFVLPELNVEYPAWEKNLELKGFPDQNADLSKPEFSNLITVSEVLDSLPGTSVVIPGGPGAVVSPKLGGIVGNKVLVIKDGIPINDPFTGSPDIGSFDSNSFEKVEVYKGNHASKWGNNGMGGVINLMSSLPKRGKLRFNTDGVGGFGYSFEKGLEIGSGQFGFRKSHFFT
ncbi:MAG: TonB-dependent receptor, partial [Candidatus Rifleibacteriota bacterium]